MRRAQVRDLLLQEVTYKSPSSPMSSSSTVRHLPTASRRAARTVALLRSLLTCLALAVTSGTIADSSPPPGGGLATTGDYVVRFVQYVRWPADESIAAWQVCIATGSAAKTATYAERISRGRPFATRAVSATDTLADCQILDLTDTPPTDAKPLLQRARPLAILTVGDGEAFCSAGGIACLRKQPDAGGFEINLSAVQQARLAVNPQLLMLGRRRVAAGGAP